MRLPTELPSATATIVEVAPRLRSPEASAVATDMAVAVALCLLTPPPRISATETVLLVASRFL